MIATAILNRLLHYSYVLNIRGENYQIKDKHHTGVLSPNRLVNNQSDQDNTPTAADRVGHGETGDSG